MDKEKPKILYISANGYLGGAERFVLNALIGHQQSGKIESELCCFDNGNLVEKAREAGIKVHVLKNKFRVSRVLSLVKACLELRKIIVTKNFKVIHSTMPYAHLVASIATLAIQIKRIWFQHGPVWNKLDFVAQFFPPDLIYFNSNFTKQKHLSMPFAKITMGDSKIISLGIQEAKSNNEESNNVRTKYLEENETKLLLSVGRVTSWKGQHLAIQAIENLKKLAPELFEQTKLLIVGSPPTPNDERYYQSLKELVEEKGLRGKVQFISHTNDIEAYYQASDILIHTSTTPEPFGLVVAEAMTYDSLIIGANAGGIKEILVNKKTGLCYETSVTNSPDLLVEVLQFALKNPEQMTSLIEAARINIAENYSIEKMTQELEADLIS